MSDKRGFQVDVFFIILVLGSVVWAWFGVNTLIDKWDEPFNSVGDFLAGWFAPLAFMWFIYTAIMQKVELNLARQVAEDQAKALDGQLRTQTINHMIEAIRAMTPDLHAVRDLNQREFAYANPVSVYCESRELPFDRDSHIGYRAAIHHCFFRDDPDRFVVRQLIQRAVIDEVEFTKYFKVLDAVEKNDLTGEPLVEAFLSDTRWGWMRCIWACCRWMRENEREVNEVLGLEDWSEGSFDEYFRRRREEMMGTY